MDSIAVQLERLAEVTERLLGRLERRDREDRDRQLVEKWGERPVAKLDIAVFLNSIPGLAQLFDRRVPPEFFATTGDHEYTIACPCGHEPVLRSGQLIKCECSRWFLHDGLQIWVALSPQDGPSGARSLDSD